MIVWFELLQDIDSTVSVRIPGSELRCRDLYRKRRC